MLLFGPAVKLSWSDGMKYVYAALLLHAMGKEISEENLAKVIQAAGGEPDMIRIKALAAALSEIDVDEVLKSATTVPPVTPTAVPVQAPAKGVEKEEEEKVEEEEEKEEEAFEGLASLFG